MRPKVRMCRLSCVQNFLCPEYRAFKNNYLQTFVRSIFFPDRLILNALRPCCVQFGLDISNWVRDRSLGIIMSLFTVNCQPCALFDLARIENADFEPQDLVSLGLRPFDPRDTILAFSSSVGASNSEHLSVP